MIAFFLVPFCPLKEPYVRLRKVQSSGGSGRAVRSYLSARCRGFGSTSANLSKSAGIENGAPLADEDILEDSNSTRSKSVWILNKVTNETHQELKTWSLL